MDTDRVVVITGAAGGIGTEIVDRFLANGDRVVATDLNQDTLGKWRESRPADAALVTTAADLSTPEGCAQLADVAREWAGAVDVLVNCAGWFPFTPFEKMTLDEWRRVIDVNLTSVFLVTQSLLPLMKDRGWGRIIYFGSASVFVGVPGQSHYVAAKAGILGLARSLARELGDYGITVNIVAPGVTLTEPVRKTFPEDLLKVQRAGRALHRDQVAEDLVGPAFYLASDDAGFVTGQILNVNGGIHFL
ncbi:SDR family NAD(P)-dependent oxidoreductase [Amycolatopsis pithecellobii]|uniref:SDR family oxidoreductase n=1 Tax=Amycolatopsis pithecellobii TaxID=664692 RepID=A0A6N7YZI7_9PSEU|nr:SDR family oxidoreductase [Amycolatopsis pithecellobii]MTD53849.1 SDR family oxidoreductase [Amycolatopsis pithecellobii]